MVNEKIIYTGIAEFTESIRKNLISLITVFLVSVVLTIGLLRGYLFNKIQDDVLKFARMQGYEVEISFINPFEIILLQAKIGIIVGLIITLPIFVFYLFRRKNILKGRLNKKKLFITGLVSIILFLFGVYYAYFFMVPFFVQFASFLAIEAGIKPFFRITSFINFVLLYSIFLGIVTEIPLIMVLGVKTKIVTYRFIKEKWKYFIIISSAIAAIATPPDPLTQATVLGPMIIIYVIGLVSVRIFAKKQIKENKQKTLKNDEQDSKLIDSKDKSNKELSDKKNKQEKSQLEKSIDNIKQNNLISKKHVELFRSLETELSKRKKRFIIIFSVASIVTFWWLVFYGLEQMISHTKSLMPSNIAGQVTTVQLTIFELLFLVTKYSILIGIISIIIPISYYSYSVFSNKGLIDTSKLKYTVYILSIFFLFVLGGFLAYFVGIPILIRILSSSIILNDMNATFSITKLINFVLIICLVVGVIAEMPVAMYFLVKTKLIRFKTFRKKWKHAIIGSLIVGALITGPDPFTAIVIAVPLFVFYLISIVTTRILCHSTIKQKRKQTITTSK